METDLVLGLSVDTLEDINLARGWPVGTEHPVCGPDTGDAARHMGNIGDEETVSEGVVRGDTDRPSAVGGVLCLVVYAHVDSTIDIASQTLRVGGVGVDVVDKAVCGIFFIEELEGLEKVGRVVCGLEGVLRVGVVLCKRTIEQGREAQREDGGMHCF